MRVTFVRNERWAIAAAVVCCAPLAAHAQGAIRGTVVDQGGRPVPGAAVHLGGTQLGAIVDSSGNYRVARVPAGTYVLRVLRLGYSPDTAAVVVADGQTLARDFRLQAAPEVLGSVMVTAQRLGETQASALSRRADAPNVVNVLAGDVIRALPNANAAEAAGRIPGVTTERDEGEGKFVQIRGTEPRLTNVTVDGAHIPGTERGSRVPKLDDVPSDLLAAVEVSKTLTADMDADAIGGSVNLVTKTPEGAPGGYVSGQYGAITLLNKSQYQGGFGYGGRFGPDRRLGLLIGGSADRNNRTTNDLEPAWSTVNGRPTPIEWSQRDYEYRRNRYGLGGDVDYRFAGGSAISLKGMYSRFEDFGTTYNNDVALGDNSVITGSGSTGTITEVAVQRMVFNRTPVEQLFGGNLSGRTQWGGTGVRATLNASGTTSRLNDYRFAPFNYSGSQPLTIGYDVSNTKVPTFHYLTAAQGSAASDPANFALTNYFTIDRKTTGRDLGGALDLSTPWHVGGLASTLAYGGKIRDETKHFDQTGGFWFLKDGVAGLPLSGALSGFSDLNYFHQESSAFTLGRFPNVTSAHRFEDAHAGDFVNGTNTTRNSLASLTGSERIYAAYVSNTFAAGPASLDLGLRVENTHAKYTGHSAVTDDADNTTISTVPGSQTYTDLFPSAQLKYAFSPHTDGRLAVTRGIARPDYASLAPSLSATLGGSRSDPNNLTVGNPSLRPQHAWNYDAMLEHFFPSVGVLSGGVFYKQLTDFIFQQEFTYVGSDPTLAGQHGLRPQNGGAGHLAGVEAEWAQRLVFLPGALAGLGFDANYTHVESRVLVDVASGRHAPLQRQSPNLANAALTYDLGRVSARAAWAYQGANITSYGDGTATPEGDVYYYAHSQVDASVIYNVSPRLQVQLQGLNLNDAVFGFFAGTPSHDYAIQREYYGRTIYLGAKYNL